MKLYLLIGILVVVVATMVQDGESFRRRRFFRRVFRHYCKHNPWACLGDGVDDEKRLRAMLSDVQDGKMSELDVNAPVNQDLSSDAEDAQLDKELDDMTEEDVAELEDLPSNKA
ncbi:uncharacterized protein LOC106159904 [Lingula anatina]|uniref:Uncharacterized protein LOC106159904 n=1 Tax=Lingula anatina TaxID=7574 RepID=A0A1S3I0L6_LINAN|nr:uncharacterized protein LOC106159904 [Lingula anatina]|eukprot:XP_013391805.1 uncharacterized protein LOC106159904 [Lingula anatina]